MHNYENYYKAIFMAALKNGGSEGLAQEISKPISAWLRSNGLPSSKSEDVFFMTHLHKFDTPSESGIALALCVESFDPMESLYGLRGDEWITLMGSLGLYCEFQSYITIIFQPVDEELLDAVKREARFEWVSRLVAPDFAAIYRGVYRYFGENPERMREMHWREFEELLASVFLAQGYETTLGPGGGDEGVDLRLVRNSVYGDLVTVVQVKRRGRRAINLENVAALSGIMMDQGAGSGIYVTSSRYLPSARRFAQRQEREIKLATSSEVAEWCQAISQGKTRSGWLDFDRLYAKPELKNVVVAQRGVTIIDYQFGYVIRETPRAALISLLQGIDRTSQ